MAYSCTASPNVFKLHGLLNCTLTHTDKMPRAYLILAIILLLSMSFHNLYRCSKNSFWKVETANKTCLKGISPLRRTNSSYRTCKWSDQDVYPGTAGMEDNYDLWKALLESYTLGLSYMKEEFSSMKKGRCVHTTMEVPPSLCDSFSTPHLLPFPLVSSLNKIKVFCSISAYSSSLVRLY